MATFLLGITASLLATAIWYLLAVLAAYRKMGHLVGYWFQVIPEFTGRTYSIGQFTYNRNSRSFQWDGTNYLNDGTPHCEWENIHLHVDLPARKLLYIYRGNRHSEPFSQFYGFGVMNLKDDADGKLVPTTGHFQDALEAAMPQHFTLCRLDDLALRLDLEQGSRTLLEYHRDIVLRYREQCAGNSPVTAAQE